MAAKTRGQLQEMIRTQLDVDDIELPNATIDPWLDDAFERVMGTDDRWPGFEAEWTLSTVADQLAYTKATFGNSSGYLVDQIISITDYTDSANVFDLKALSHDKAKAVFGLGQNQGTVPAYWSEWNASIYLWPAPGQVRSLRIDGYRLPSWSSSASAEPDCDARLHLCLFYFGCAMAYAQQEDDVLEADYMRQFDASLRQAHRRVMATPQRRPVVMSGGGASLWWPQARLDVP